MPTIYWFLTLFVYSISYSSATIMLCLLSEYWHVSIAWLWSPCLGLFCNNNNRRTIHYASHKLNFHYIKLLLKPQMTPTTWQNKKSMKRLCLNDAFLQTLSLHETWMDSHRRPVIWRSHNSADNLTFADIDRFHNISHRMYNIASRFECL